MIVRVVVVLCALGASLAAPRARAQPHEEVEEPVQPGARIELSLFSAPLGAAAGMFVCLARYCAEPGYPEGYVFSSLGGASVGVIGTALVTRSNPIAYATAQAIEGGAVWGTITSFSVDLLVEDVDDSMLFASLLLGELSGAGLGAVLERTLRPTSGAVAFANSGALWLSTTAILLTFAIKPEPDYDHDRRRRGLGGGLLAAELIGLGLGGMLGQRFKATRGQALLSDAGATLLGGILPLLAWGIGENAVGERALYGSAAAGTVLGFAGAYTLTELVPRHRRAALERTAARLSRVQLAMMPLRQGGGVSLSTRLH